MPATLKLCKPILAHGELVNELAFRDPCARDLKDFKIGDPSVGNFMSVIGALAGIPPSSVEAMHPSDIFDAVELIGPLLLPPPATGTTS